MAKKKSDVESPVEGEPRTCPRIEIEYDDRAEGFTCNKYDEDGVKEMPPLVWHNDTLDGIIKQLAQEQNMKVVISIQLVPKNGA